MKIRILFAAILLLCAGSVLLAQTPVQVQKVELSIPFGTVSGRLITVGDYLIFLDEDRPDASWAVTRNQIQNVAADSDMITVDTRQPVRDRSGERSRMVFRVREGDTAPLTRWFNMAPTTTGDESRLNQTATPGPTTTDNQAGQLIYEAEHDHFIGSCHGRLLIAQTVVAYESVDKIEDSRQWQLKDIKEIRQKNPYELEIIPFRGDKYNLKLLGKGMDTGTYKALVDRITAARVSR
jgi:hypothetical protein